MLEQARLKPPVTLVHGSNASAPSIGSYLWSLWDIITQPLSLLAVPFLGIWLGLCPIPPLLSGTAVGGTGYINRLQRL